jgi:hypothetical protein
MRYTRIILAAIALLAVTAIRAMAADGTPSATPPLAQPEVQRTTAANDDPGGLPPIPEPPAPGERVAQPQPVAPEPAAPVPPATGVAPAPYPPTAAATSSNAAAPCPQPCCRNGCGCRECDRSERPFGACVRAALNCQLCAGLKARMVLYQYDFCDAAACDGYKLSPKGVVRLAEIARMLPASSFSPITIEAAFQNPKLDAARRAYVLQTLNQLNLPVPEQLVVVGAPQAGPGVSGAEALIVNQNIYRDVKAGGSQLPTSNASYGQTNGGTGTGGNSAAGNSNQ